MRQSTYPLASDGSERFKRSLVCSYSPLWSLRPRLRSGESWRAGAGRVRREAFLSILLPRHSRKALIYLKLYLNCLPHTSPYGRSIPCEHREQRPNDSCSETL